MNTSNPWKTLRSRIAYENPWIRVREDAVITPDGSEGIYGVVECRKATGVVALTHELEVYLVGQYRYAMDEYSWEIIEGGSDEGESALEAAQRELEEEAGVRAADWHELGDEVHLTNCHSSERGYLFLAENLEHTESSPDATEILQLKTVPLMEAFAMSTRGEIRDAMSIIGLQRAVDFLQQQGRM